MSKQDLLSPSDLAFDQNHIWHPYTSLTKPLKVYPVQSASGVYLHLQDGRKLIDGMASWWCTIHGYQHPKLNAAAKQQLDDMSHVMFGGITHAPAVRLAQKLVALTPDPLDRVFLCDSGSVSVEVAMKMAIQYQQALGQEQKHHFLTFKKGYHGDTTGAMSVCDPVSGMHHLFTRFMPKHFFLEAPQLGYDQPISATEKEHIIAFFEAHAWEAAAFILEPVVQGAGGMRIYNPAYLTLIRQLCDQHGLLLIADEIATGFGRTGELFAVEHANIVPDIMCLGKALTGGYMTLAATLCTPSVATTICNGAAGVMMHGPTFMGNPLACAVATASLELLETGIWKEQVYNIEASLHRGLAAAKTHPAVKDVRILGAIGVLELHEHVDVAQAQALLIERGVWLRPFRNLMYIMPPYICTPAEIQQLCKAMLEVVNQIGAIEYA